MPRLCLYFSKAFDDPVWAGSSFSLDAPEGDHGHGHPGEWIVGRHPIADLTLAPQTISLRHCSLSYSYASDRWFVCDLGSRNGTWLNGKRLEMGNPHPLKLGDKLHLGPNPIQIVEDEHATEDHPDPQTVAGLAPLDYRTGEPPPPPAPPALPPAHPPPKTWADALHLGAEWLISPSTVMGGVYRLLILALAALVVVLVMGAL